MKIDDLPGRATITVPQAGSLLGLSKSAAYRAAAAGELPGVRRVCGRVMVSAPVLLAWLLGQDVATPGSPPEVT